MKIIYCCYGGSHSSVTAAAIHVGILPTTNIPSSQQLLSVPYYDKQTGKDHGYFHYIGIDSDKNPVYIVGKHNLGKHFEEIIRQIADIFQIKQRELIIVDTMPYVNYTMMIGGFSSRRLGITLIGRPIVIWGTKKAYWGLINLVNRIKTTVASRKK
jgi:hypothetical protein